MQRSPRRCGSRPCAADGRWAPEAARSERSPAGSLPASALTRLVELPVAGHTAQLDLAQRPQLDIGPAGQVADGAGHQDLARPRLSEPPCGDVDGDPAEVVAAD